MSQREVVKMSDTIQTMSASQANETVQTKQNTSNAGQAVQQERGRDRNRRPCIRKRSRKTFTYLV